MRPILLAAALLALAGPAHSAEDLRRETDIRPDGRLTIRNVAGNVTVKAAPGPLVVVAAFEEGGLALEITGSAAHRRVEVTQPDEDEALEAELQVQVPPGVELDIETVSADVTVQGGKAPLAARTVSGDVRLDSAGSRVAARTVSGDIMVEGKDAEIEAKTISGDLRVAGARGLLTAESVSGDVHAEVAGTRRARVQSVSGDLHLRARLEAAGQLEAETMSGDVHLWLPAKTSAALSARSFSGEASSELPEGAASRGEALSLKLGAGQGRIELQTFSGDVLVRKE